MDTSLDLMGLSGQSQTISLWSLVPPQYQAMIVSAGIALFVGIIVIYIYTSLAFMSIGRKAGLKSPGVAWINSIVSIFEVSGMHWWPWPMLVFGSLIGSSLMFSSQILASVIIYAVFLTFTVMTVIWHWKMFEAINKPGWWALVAPIMSVLGFGMFFVSPILGLIILPLAGLVYLVLVGIAAWSK